MAGGGAGREPGHAAPGAGSGARVTVVIPTRNRAALLRRSIESVLAQTYPHFELLVADNASDDETPDVVAAFADSRIRYVRRDTDIGHVANFEEALRDVATDYVTILPDDDLVRPAKLEVAVRVMDANPNAGLLHSRYDEVDAADRLLRSNVDPTRGRLSGDAVEPGERFVREAVRTSRHAVFPTAFLRTSALPSPRFDPRDDLAIDLGLWLRVALDWDVAFVASPLAAVRSHASMLSSAAGFFDRDRYVQGFDMVRMARDAKVRFLRSNVSRFPDVGLLLHDAERVARRHMLGAVWNLRVGGRQIRPSLGMLAEGIRTEPRLLGDPATYGVLGAIFLGPALGERARGRLSGHMDARRGLVVGRGAQGRGPRAAGSG